jgi:pantetheine-phosphate adenylyltransferase
VRPYRHAVLGGTFDHLHAGHEALLAAAFRAGRSVSIGVTTDRYLAEHPKPGRDRLQPYATRARALRRWLGRHYPRRRWRAVPLENRFGRSVEPGVDVLVVSVDTLDGGRAVNAERQRLGRPTVPFVVVPVVLADDLGPVSSRRIRAGEIDARGHRRAPIRIGVALDAAEDRVPVARAVRTAFPSARVSFVRPSRSVRRSSSQARVRGAAARAGTRRDLGVAVLRAPGGGWWIAENGGGATLEPRRVPRGPPSGLERATLALLRPSRA